MNENEILLEGFKMVKHKIQWEGFEYCFKDYSEWKEVKDEDFHILRLGYENGTITAHELGNYINEKIVLLESLTK